MPGKRKITIDTLTELGAHKLAELLIAEAAGNRKLKQAIGLAISAKEGPVALGAAVRKRLAGFVKSRSMPSYERGREIIVEFDALRTMIVENIGVENPRLALDLLWELIELHPSILELVDDSSGYAGDVFTAACYDLGPLAERASIDPDALAELVLQKITNNHYGIYDGLITSLNAALGREGRAKLRGLLLQRRQQYVTNDKVAANSAGRHDFTLGSLSLALRDIAEIEGDTDAFIDTYQGRDLTNPHFASEIALQLLRAGRAEEALNYLDRAQPSEQNRHFGQSKWTDARVATLEALKRTDEAQALRLVSAYPICAHTFTSCPISKTSRRNNGPLIMQGDMPMFMRRCPSWSNGRPTSVPLNWCCHGIKKSTATATNCSIRRLALLKENTRWPRFSSGARSSRSRCVRPVPHATSTPRGMSVKLIV